MINKHFRNSKYSQPNTQSPPNVTQSEQKYVFNEADLEPITTNKAKKILDSSKAKNNQVFYQNENNQYQRVCFIQYTKQELYVAPGDCYQINSIISLNPETKFFIVRLT